MKKVITVFTIICLLGEFAFSQNFGIDQPSPTEKLDVNGNIKSSNLAGTGLRPVYHLRYKIYQRVVRNYLYNIYK